MSSEYSPYLLKWFNKTLYYFFIVVSLSFTKGMFYLSVWGLGDGMSMRMQVCACHSTYLKIIGQPQMFIHPFHIVYDRTFYLQLYMPGQLGCKTPGNVLSLNLISPWELWDRYALSIKYMWALGVQAPVLMFSQQVLY